MVEGKGRPAARPVALPAAARIKHLPFSSTAPDQACCDRGRDPAAEKKGEGCMWSGAWMGSEGWGDNPPSS